MQLGHVFEVVWEYKTDDSQSHSTLVEIGCTSTLCAVHAFRRYYESIHPNCSSLTYEIISVTYLGTLNRR